MTEETLPAVMEKEESSLIEIVQEDTRGVVAAPVAARAKGHVTGI